MSSSISQSTGSIDVTFYYLACGILNKLLSNQGTINSLCLAPSIKKKKNMVALISETLKYKEIITEIIERCKLLPIDKKVSITHISLLAIQI